MSRLFKASAILFFFYGLNKVIALFRQIIIVKQFGITAQIDVYNVSNNFPDLIFSLISGGVLAMAFIPVLTQYIEKGGRDAMWRLFANITNIVFVSTALSSLVIALFAPQIVGNQFGIAPGFSLPQQQLVVNLMRINLIATLIFSVSGLAMSALQAHKRFFLTALAPIFYNVGQIVGAVIFVPTTGIHIAGVTLPALGMGIYGLGWGVVLGALLHLFIQVPGLFEYNYKWYPVLNLMDKGVQSVLRLVAPRILTVLLIQFMFIARDNLASRLQAGSVTALTYGYFIMQVPETLIGTAIGTALLPTLAQYVSRKKTVEFEQVLKKTIAIIIAVTTMTTVLIALLLPQLIHVVFNFSQKQTDLLTWTTQAYLLGLVSQVLLEVLVRAFYARQKAALPLVATTLRTVFFIILSLLTFSSLGPIGLALADSLAVTLEVIILLFVLHKTMSHLLAIAETLLRVGTASLLCIVAVMAILTMHNLPELLVIIIAALVGCTIYSLFIFKEIKALLRL